LELGIGNLCTAVIFFWFCWWTLCSPFWGLMIDILVIPESSATWWYQKVAPFLHLFSLFAIIVYKRAILSSLLALFYVASNAMYSIPYLFPLFNNSVFKNALKPRSTTRVQGVAGYQDTVTKQSSAALEEHVDSTRGSAWPSLTTKSLTKIWANLWKPTIFRAIAGNNAATTLAPGTPTTSIRHGWNVPTTQGSHPRAVQSSTGI
jgi:hypothetical protein